jgi:hypothetical protein
MVIASRTVRAEASAAADETIYNHPGSEWFVVKAALIVFMMGLLVGMCLMYKMRVLTAKKVLKMRTIRSQSTKEQMLARQVFMA